MKQVLIILKLLLFTYILGACSSENENGIELKDGNSTLVKEGKVWSYGPNSWISAPEITYTEFFSKDTLIADKSYKKLYRQYAADGRVEYVGAMRESKGQVFGISMKEQWESLIYDFSLDVNMKVSFNDGYIISIEQVSRLNERKSMSVMATDSNRGSKTTGTWLEGVGSCKSSLFNSHYFDIAGGLMLYSCKENGQLIYQNEKIRGL